MRVAVFKPDQEGEFMKPRILILVLAIIAVTVISCGQETTLTVTPDHLPAGGGSVTVFYKTDGYTSAAAFVLTSNPPLPGFPIPWSSNMSQTIPNVTVTTTTTFTITTVPAHDMVTSKTVSVGS
jgi:hypothetical protein